MRSLPLLVLMGCTTGSADRVGGNAEPLAADGFSAALRVDIVPGVVRTESGGVRALPTSLLRQFESAEVLDLQTVALVPPVEVGGVVAGFRTNPTIADVPGQTVPVSATVALRNPGTIQSWLTRTDALGAFDAWVVPGVDYDLSIVPDDPMIPTWAGVLADSGDLGTLDLGSGAPLYGTVTSPEGPVPFAQVWAEQAGGVRTPIATADADGYFQLRVSPGTWTVVCDGRSLGQDPTLARPDVEVPALGAYVPFAYPHLDSALVSGSVLGPDDAPVANAVVRFVSRSLLGHDAPDLVASWTGDVTVSANGTYLVRVVPGVYDVEVLPPVTEAPTDGPSVTRDVVVAQDTALELATSRLRAVEGTVRDEDGSPLSDARVTCQEIGFDGRTYTGFTLRSGRFALELPPVPVRCEILPPGDRTDLALAVATTDASAPGARRFVLVRGLQVVGRVEVAGESEVGAVVEVHGEDGSLLGYDLTDRDGAFDLQVDPRR